MEVLKFIYRKTFGLTAEEMQNEPITEFFTNLYILGQINEREADEIKHRSK